MNHDRDVPWKANDRPFTIEKPKTDLTAFIIGGARPQRVPALVTQHSIQRHQGGRTAVIYHTWPMVHPEPLDPKNKARTGFSFVRHFAPDIVKEARAVYLDSDMLVLAPWGELADFNLRGACVAVPANQCAVVVYDIPRCQAAWNLDDLFKAMDTKKTTYPDVMSFRFLKENDQIVRDLPDAWNCCDRKSDASKLLHYTNMRRQPWVAEGHPLNDFWVKALIGAVKAEVLSWDEVEEDIGAGHLRPTILRDVKRVEGLVEAGRA